MSLINSPASAETFVYHYTSHEVALKFILAAGTLRLNPLARVNDPRESKLWEPVVAIDSARGMELDDWKALSDGVGQAFQRGVKLACFTMDAATTVRAENLGARSKRGYASAPMWHQYAHKHTGVCLMFDRDLLERALKTALGEHRLFSGPVEYTDIGWVPLHRRDPFAVSLDGVVTEGQFQQRILTHLSAFWRDLYLRKLTDWSHEREYRWLYLGEGDEPVDVPYGQALKGIVIGELTPFEDDAFYGHCVFHHASCARINWRNGQPSLQHYAEPFVTHRHLMP